ncbi:UNVERIFIED_CONTAM: hypothetical protein Sindi_2672600 [Sesamum indicum]
MAELPLWSVSAIGDSEKTAKATTTTGSSTVNRIYSVFTNEKGPTLVFTEAETKALVAPFRLALVGKFSHGKPLYRHLHRLIAGLGVKGAFTVNMINAKHVLILLSNESDFSYLSLRRIWHIQGFPMCIFKWTPTFTPTQESSTIPVWVCFPELPAHLFHKDALFAIANMIGTPLQIDDCTLNQSKLSKARLGIDIDLTKPLVKGFDLQINGVTIHQKVEYEQLPKYCNLCKHVGNDNLECYTMGNAPRPPPPSTSQAVERYSTNLSNDNVDSGKHGNDFGEIETSGVNCDSKVENDVHIDNANCIAHDDNMPTMVRKHRISNNIADENVVSVDVADTTSDNDKTEEDNLEYKVADGNWTHVKNTIMLLE